MKRTALKRTGFGSDGRSKSVKLQVRRALRRSSGISRTGRRSRERASELERFREAVLERDGFACRRCGLVPARAARRLLHAHHVLPRGRGGRNDLANGVTLCWKCHRAVHDHTCADWRRWVASPRKRTGCEKIHRSA